MPAVALLPFGLGGLVFSILPTLVHCLLQQVQFMSQALRLIGPIGYVLFGIFVAGATILPLLDNFAEPVIDGDLGMGYYIKIA